MIEEVKQTVGDVISPRLAPRGAPILLPYNPAMACKSTSECNAITADAAKWRSLCDRLQKNKGGAAAVADDSVVKFIDSLFLDLAYRSMKAEWYDEIKRECDRYGKPLTISTSEFVGQVFALTKKNYESFDRTLAVCKAQGMAGGQTVSHFVNELAENLRSANCEREDVVEQCERIGYVDGGAETLVEFLERTADDVEEFGFNTDEEAATFNDCTFNLTVAG